MAIANTRKGIGPKYDDARANQLCKPISRKCMGRQPMNGPTSESGRKNREPKLSGWHELRTDICLASNLCATVVKKERYNFQLTSQNLFCVIPGNLTSVEWRVLNISEDRQDMIISAPFSKGDTRLMLSMLVHAWYSIVGRAREFI